jgi:ABC-type antimicrobial peptide transport system permease subunit
MAAQTREIGIRMVLGADRRQLRLSILFTGMRLALGGASVGALASGLATRVIGLVLVFVTHDNTGSWGAVVCGTPRRSLSRTPPGDMIHLSILEAPR